MQKGRNHVLNWARSCKLSTKYEGSYDLCGLPDIYFHT
jgi:hypothetical protein